MEGEAVSVLTGRPAPPELDAHPWRVLDPGDALSPCAAG